MKTLPDSVKKFRLGVYTSDLQQPISLMRVLGPLSAMAKEDRRLELVFPPLELPDASCGRAGGQQLNWNWLVQCDAIFLLHPESDVHVHCASLAYQLGIPIWAEYVDDVFNVHPNNPGFQFHKNKRMLRENIGSIAKWARVVTCVSEYNRTAILAGLEGKAEGRMQNEEGAAETSNIEHRTPNAELENKFLVIPEGCLWPRWDLERKKCVSWRGLGSHGHDVQEALPQLMKVAKAFPDWTWMLGGDPQILEEMGHFLSPICGAERVLLSPYWPTPFEAMQAWGSQCPYLHIVPLADTAFNKSKSHLAWLEASAIGAAVIAPDHLPEWNQTGVIPYRHSNLELGSHNGLNSTLAEVMKREMARFEEGRFHPNVQVAREAIYPNLTLGAMNKRRWAILHKLATEIFDLENIEQRTSNAELRSN